jgi:hypothetical protein
MKKLTLALAVLLANLMISHAEIGDTMKEVLGYSNSWKPIQFHNCPALQASDPMVNVTAIFSPKTNREIASVWDSRQLLITIGDPAQAWNLYGRWQLVQNNAQLASWHLKHPRFGDLWMVVTAKAHVIIVATPEGLETLGLHAAKSPGKKASTR